jgi:predicted Zn-dependent protease
MNNKKILELTLLMIICISMTSCETLNVQAIGAQQQYNKEEDEKRLWKRSEEFEEILQKSGFIYDNKELNEYLNKLVDSILPEKVKATGCSIRAYVLKDPSFNAFMTPNGFMYIHTGLLSAMENEAQLATVLGHELVHFTNRHSLKFFRSLKNMSAFYSTLSVTSAAFSPYSSYGDLSNLLIQYSFLSSVTGYSREMEYEADKGGFELLLKNNYDIQQSPKAFEILERQIREEKIKEPYFFSTHPKVKERKKNFESLCNLHKENSKDKEKITGEDAYNTIIKNLILNNAMLDIKKGRFKSANRAIERFLKLEPQNSRGFYSLGELYRNRKDPGDLEMAIDNFKKAISLDNSFALAHRELGIIYYKNKQKDKAIKEFEIYLVLAPQGDNYEYITKYLHELKGEEGKENEK